MDALRAALDNLDRESKELIVAAQQAVCEAVLKHNALPAHVAVALAQRFTPERIHGSYPTLCLIDALVQLSRSATADGAAAKATLDVFWKSAPMFFTGYHQVEESTRRKAERLVRRWGTRKQIPSALENQLVTAMSTPSVAEEDDSRLGDATAPPTSSPLAGGDRRSDAARDASAEYLSGASAWSGAKTVMTQQELELLAHTLRNCLAIMERLPPERAYLYVQLLSEEGSLDVRLQPTALTAMQSLWGDLQRDDFVLSARGLGSAAARDGRGAGQGQHTDTGASAQARSVGAAPSEAAAALGRLFDRLSAAEGNAAGATGAGLASPAGRPLPPALAAPTQPVRYVSPLLTDTLALQSLQQRPGGYGPLLCRKVAGGVGGAGYYPRFSSLCVSRRFRPRVRTTAGAPRSQRRGFPSAQEWVSTSDMERIALVDAGAETDASRKRPRE